MTTWIAGGHDLVQLCCRLNECDKFGIARFISSPDKVRSASARGRQLSMMADFIMKSAIFSS